MFGASEKTKIEHFLEVASVIANAAPTGMTATQKKSIATIIQQVSSSEAEDFQGLVGKLNKKRAVRQTRPKKTKMTADQIGAVVSELVSLSKDRSEFEALVDQLNKKYTAPELKALTAGFVAGARPKTKAEAIRILKAERNDRDRAARKATEAGSARPW